MLSDLIRKLTVIIALVLVGLVGGIGTGLHSVFDCCHHCHCSSNSCTSSSCTSSSCTGCPRVAGNNPSEDNCNCVFCDAAVTSAACARYSNSSSQTPNSSTASVVASSEDCAICRLLSHYHSTPTTEIPEHYIWASPDIVAISIPAVIPDTSLRLEHSRGPPA